MNYVAEIKSGRHGRVLVRSRSSLSGNDFLEFLLAVNRDQPAYYRRAMAMLHLWATEGKKGKKRVHWDNLDTKKGLVEWRPVPYRIVWFRDGSDAIISHGFRKKTNGTPQSEINKGLGYMEVYLEAKQADDMEVQVYHI